jgi:hypothetical protein
VAALVLFTRHRDFPYLYHTDEPSKVAQVIEHEYNCNHPLLLLRATEGLVQFTGTPLLPQSVVEKGRVASAVFAAIAVGALVLLASQLAGRVAGTLTGALALTHPVLFELAHYMKEDCALLMGVAITAAALVAYARRPSMSGAALVGLGAGLGVSGKYLGLLTAIFALLAIAVNSSGTIARWKTVVLALAATIITFGAINYPALTSKRLATSLETELEKVEKRSQQRPESVQFKHLSKLGTTLSVPLLLGLVYWLARRWRARRHEPFAFRAMGAFLLVYFLIISLAPKTKDRYLLPIYILACGFGAAGMVEWHRHFRKHRKSYSRGIPRVIAGAAVAWHLPSLVDAYQAFQRDDRRELAEFIRATVPAEGGIAHDVRVLLARAKQAGLEPFVLPNPIHVPPDRYVADLGSIAELRARGITHVAVCEADYHNTFKQGSDPKMAARSRWYAELFQNHSEVWQRRVGEIAYLQPGLRLYRITPDSPPPPPQN